jgi:hypothetical protein
MTYQRLLNKVLSVLAFLFTLTLVTSAGTGSLNAAPRIWVQYKVGRKAIVREALVQMGAIFNYDFGDLNAFVVSMPEKSIPQIAHHPDVADYWYAQATSKSNP